ncbi:cytochrome P450 [Canariomyces notabilis]|uniref:Cytochrome P450 n=1 Tax=Canariomyces notabilis TaxID=2074819 RepID=A0AAN6TDM7_9PEZI|nr:cytochrome P450 [Canariomyces arenarius]
MPSAALIWSLLGLVLLATAVRRLLRWRRLSHVPGPMISGWTSLCPGPLVRVAPNIVVCADPDAIYHIHGVRSGYTKAEWYNIARISPNSDNIMSMIETEQRRERKKYIMPAYTGRGVDAFEEGVDKSLQAWIDLIERKYISDGGKSKPMDLGKTAHFYALDAIAEIAYGQSFGHLEKDEDVHNIIATNNASVPMMMLFNNYVFLWKMMQRWPLYYLLPRDGDKSGFGAVLGHVNKLIGERLRPNASPKHDMLQSFIAHGLRGKALSEEVGIQFFAGSDTVASVIRTTLLLLMTHPRVYQRLQAELDGATAANRLSRPLIRESEARALPYLQAVIREGLRLFPPGALPPFFKQVPAPRGDTLCGYDLPGGTWVAVGCAVYGLNRDNGFWGADGDVFRPERWLAVEQGGDGPGEDRLAAMLRRVELVWGAGQFVCVGRMIAMVEINKVFPELMRRYNFSLVDPFRPPKLVNTGVWDAHDFIVTIERR